MTEYVLSQIADLQSRLSSQEATIATLKSQLESQLGSHVGRGYSVAPMRMSVPLHDGRPPRGPRRDPRDPRDPRNRDPRDRDPRDPRDRRQSTPHPTLSLSDVLQKNENVTIEIKTGLNDGVQTYAVALTSFDGTNLNVTQCDLANSLVGMKSSKPGEVLYRFMEELKEAGHIKNTFGIAPWKLCFVERNGVRVSLEELRSTVG